jgi:uncharacterized protein
LLALFALVSALFSLPARAEEAPIPPRPQRFVTDTVGFVSERTRANLDARLEAYERATGHQVVVLIAPTSGATPLEDYAVRVFEAWKPGRKGIDDGLLMVVLAHDRRIAIEVGYGLEDRVPDAIASRVIREVMTPRLQAGNPDQALREGVDALLTAIEGKAFAPGAPPAAERPASRPSIARLILYGVLALLFLLRLVTHPELALAMLFSIGGRGGGLGGGGGGFSGGFSGGGGRSGGGGARGSW